MAVRSGVIALAVVAGLFGASLNQAKAAVPPPPLPPPAAVFGAGAIATTAFLGVIGVVCIVDIFLKINGLKNWDGTPKAAPGHHHH